MEHKVISRIDSGLFRYQAWPTVTKGADGTLYVGCSGHRMNHICPFGKNYMYTSTDEGKSWTGPQIINDTLLDDRDAGLLAWGDGNLHLTWFNHHFSVYDARTNKSTAHVTLEGPVAGGMQAYLATLPEKMIEPGSWTRISRDHGKTWSVKRPSPVTSPHGPCLMSDGRLLYVGQKVGTNGSFKQDDPKGTIKAYLSSDDGETWEYLSDLPIPEGADQRHTEPYAIQMANGDVLAVVRYQSLTGPSRESLRLYHTVSQDGGRSWSQAEFLDLKGAPGHLLQHSSGAVVLVYSKRCETMGEYVRISRDYGRTWSKETLIGPAAQDWDHGYPSSVELSNGDIFTVFYQKCPGDSFNSIHAVRYSLSEIE